MELDLIQRDMALVKLALGNSRLAAALIRVEQALNWWREAIWLGPIRWDFPTWACRARPFDWEHDLPELRSPDTDLIFRELGRRVVLDSRGWNRSTREEQDR